MHQTYASIHMYYLRNGLLLTHCHLHLSKNLVDILFSFPFSNVSLTRIKSTCWGFHGRKSELNTIPVFKVRPRLSMVTGYRACLMFRYRCRDLMQCVKVLNTVLSFGWYFMENIINKVKTNFFQNLTSPFLFNPWQLSQKRHLGYVFSLI